MLDKSRWCRGQSTAEFAQVAVVFFLLLSAVMMMGEAVLAYNNIAAAAEEAVRYAVANGPNSPNPATQDAIENIAVNVAPQLHLTKSTFNSNGTLNYNGNVTATWVTDSYLSTRQDVRVVISYNYALKIPWMSAVTLHLSATSQMMASQ
ncbi:MAG TPA: TadE/TadG family type IV pilus assembly protein [Candidatus Binataceae bacterium]|nr:TadE/TadG family type IV pilus assembly protein [Candidatus Binataceae bacterium]